MRLMLRLSRMWTRMRDGVGAFLCESFAAPALGVTLFALFLGCVIALAVTSATATAPLPPPAPAHSQDGTSTPPRCHLAYFYPMRSCVFERVRPHKTPKGHQHR